MSLTDASKSGPANDPSIGLGGKAIKWNRDWRAAFKTVAVLFKLRIVFLLLMAATGGAFVAAGGWPGARSLVLLWLSGGLAAAGSSSLNQYLEIRSDALMKRTKRRPLPSGNLANPRWVPVIGCLLVLLPSAAVFPFNRELSFFLMFGAFIYVVIYTIWLKPRTLLNIVIGGAAGSAAVLSGSAAVGAWNDPGALVLSLILFLWTPFHFWSLALLYRDDYQRVDVPMLPARTTPRQASLWVMAHTIPTALAGLLMTSLPSLGWLYFVPVLLVTILLVCRNLKLISDPSPAHARDLFMGSNIYLLVLMLAICFDASLPYLKI